MSVLLETLVVRLALAVRLQDDFTEGEARGLIEVSAGRRLAFRNLSGVFLFLDLPLGPTPLKVTSAFYLPEEPSTTIPRPDPRNPVIEQTLLPSRLYPFPSGITLVTGLVKSTTGAVVPDAAIAGVGRPTRSDGQGGLAAYFRALSEDDVVVVGPDRRHLVKAPDNTTNFALTVSHPLFQPKTVTVSDLDEGRERHLGEIVLTPI